MPIDAHRARLAGGFFMLVGGVGGFRPPAAEGGGDPVSVARVPPLFHMAAVRSRRRRSFPR